MLAKNSIFHHRQKRLRLLAVTNNNQTAWVIEMREDGGMPFCLHWADIVSLEAEVAPEDLRETKVSEAMTKAGIRAINMLGNLPKEVPAIFDPKVRSKLVHAQAEKAQCSVPTLYSLLKRWWRGGQVAGALIGRYNNCGKPSSEGTAGRGAKSPKYVTYQLTDEDRQLMREIAEKHYLGELAAFVDVYKKLKAKYAYTDGEGKQFAPRPGCLPSLRQFTHFIKTEFPHEYLLRRKHGDIIFNLEHRARVGTTVVDCNVGDIYEADGTVSDVHLVSKVLRGQLIGKARLYFVIDRKSQLIVGFYIGLENSSWNTAGEAIICIAEDKEALCLRYGVHYDPAHWPANALLPKEIRADNGELRGHAATRLTSELGVDVSNVPVRRAELKPIVEWLNKYIRNYCQRNNLPGFEPPEKSRKRQQNDYSKNAALTVDDLCALFLRAIIAFNCSPQKSYPLSLAELSDGVTPSPIGLWNYGVRSQVGQLARTTEAAIRQAVLHRGTATVSEHGIRFEKLHYTCAAAIAEGWFVIARSRGVFELDVQYDSRRVDNIVVVDKKGNRHQCDLTSGCREYLGLSFHEAEVVLKKHKGHMESFDQERAQIEFELQQQTESIVKTAQERQSSLPKRSKTARKEDTASTRRLEIQGERDERVLLTAASTQSDDGSEVTLEAPNHPPASTRESKTPTQSSFSAWDDEQ